MSDDTVTVPTSDAALGGLIAEAAGDDFEPVAAKAPKKGDTVFDPVAGQFRDALTGELVVKKSSGRGRSISRADFQLDTRSVFDKDPTLVHGPIVEKDGEGYISGMAGRKHLPLDPRKTYRRGTFWKVVGELTRIEAMCNYGAGANGKPIWSGWSRHVPVGTVLECIGWRRYRKDGLVAPQFVYPDLPAEAKWSTVWPHDGVWRPWPLQSLLVEITAEEAAELRAAA